MKYVLPLLMLSPMFTLQARPAFSFHRFTNLRSGQSFRVIILNKGRRIPAGSGLVTRLSAKSFDFRIEISLYGRKLTGQASLRYLRRRGNRFLLRLKYKGVRNGRPERINEVVRADAFLAKNRILTFRYWRKQRFFQLSINSRGENVLVTERGMVVIEASSGGR